MDIVLILLTALAIDIAFGEPPGALHPVVWMGRVISLLGKGVDNLRPLYQLIYGSLMTLFIIALFSAPAYFLLSWLKGINLIACLIVGALLLKSAFSLKELRKVALQIKRLLLDDKLDEARFELRALVKRDTSRLPRPLLVSAAVESVAENTCDSVVAPLFYFLLLGVPGAVGYRVVNTLDAMIGYHGKYEYLGKFAARLDDVLNFLPARLTAFLIVLASFLCRRNGRASWKIAISQHSLTESPNAGWAMSAMAGALDIQLEKAGHYRLGNARSILVPETIDDSLKIVQTATFTWLVICLISGVIRFVTT